MCKNCGCSGPHAAADLDHLSRLAAEGREDEHARMHRLGIDHDHPHGHVGQPAPAVIKVVRASPGD